jgi:hypothetical protein
MTAMHADTESEKLVSPELTSTPASDLLLESRLDEALDETFPASDPIAMGNFA